MLRSASSRRELRRRPGLLGQFGDTRSRVQMGAQEGQQRWDCRFCLGQPRPRTWRCPFLNTPVGRELTTTPVARRCCLMWDSAGLRCSGVGPGFVP